jgi:hypothetical protein
MAPSRAAVGAGAVPVAVALLAVVANMMAVQATAGGGGRRMASHGEVRLVCQLANYRLYLQLLSDCHLAVHCRCMFYALYYATGARLVVQGSEQPCQWLHPPCPCYFPWVHWCLGHPSVVGLEAKLAAVEPHFLCTTVWAESITWLGTLLRPHQELWFL